MEFAQLPTLYYQVLAFFWGAIWGSFGNVMIFRLPRGLSVVHPPSACPACHTPIRPWHNIPVLSYLWLRGRCASCRAPFSARYAVIEAICGALGVGVFMHFDAASAWTPMLVTQAAGVFFFLWLLVVLAGIDWDTFILPDTFTLGGTVLFGLFSWATHFSTLVEILSGAAAGFLLFASVSFFYRVVRKREGLGLGDAKLLALIGAVLGPLALIPLVLVAAVQGLLCALIFLAFRLHREPPVPYKGISEADPEFEELFLKKPDTWMLTPMPFGPFLSAAAIEVFFTQDLWRPFLLGQ